MNTKDIYLTKEPTECYKEGVYTLDLRNHCYTYYCVCVREGVMLKMRAVITLQVLLLSMCGSQTRSTQTEDHTESQSTGAAAAAAAEVSTQLDVSAELRELRAMVLELSGQLTVTQNELQNTKTLLNKMLIVNYTRPNDYKIYLQMDSSCVFFHSMQSNIITPLL